MPLTVLVEKEANLAVIRLNRPAKRNALSLECMRELIAALDEVAADASVRAVLLASSGKVFCSGHDLAELSGRSADDYCEIFDVCTELMQRIQAIPQPVIAEVQGTATAAGCQLVAACDLAIASETATFATPGVRIGLFCTTPMVALTRAIGRKRVMEMLLTGRAIDAQTAADWGLINRAVPAGDLEQETRSLARACADSSRYTATVGKQAFYAQIDLDQQHAYDYAKRIMTANACADDAQEGISAFLNKRPPRWEQK